MMIRGNTFVLNLYQSKKHKQKQKQKQKQKRKRKSKRKRKRKRRRKQKPNRREPNSKRHRTVMMIITITTICMFDRYDSQYVYFLGILGGDFLFCVLF